jgi:hypothetical protein
MSVLNASCKKATYLVSKKEENKLSWLEKIQLRSHMTICSMCRKFELQSGFIARNARHFHEHIHTHLSPEAKERMQAALKSQ